MKYIKNRNVYLLQYKKEEYKNDVFDLISKSTTFIWIFPIAFESLNVIIVISLKRVKINKIVQRRLKLEQFGNINNFNAHPTYVRRHSN